MFAKFLSYLIFVTSIICKSVVASDLEETQPDSCLIFQGNTTFSKGKFDESYLIEATHNYIPELGLDKNITKLQIGVPNSKSVYPAKYIEFTPKSKLYLMPSGRVDCYQNTYLNSEIVLPPLLAVNKINITSKKNIATEFNNVYSLSWKNTIKKHTFKKLYNDRLNILNSYNVDKFQYSDDMPGFFVHNSVLTIGKNAKFNKICKRKRY